MWHPYCNDLWVINLGKSSKVWTPSELAGGLVKSAPCERARKVCKSDDVQTFWIILNDKMAFTKRRIMENMEKTDKKHCVGQRRLWMFNEKGRTEGLWLCNKYVMPEPTTRWL